MILAKQVGKRYGERAVLQDVTVEIPKHTVTTIIGSNGAGKSTLLSRISRLMRGEGEVFLEGKAISDFKNKELSQRLATLRQTNHINVRLTVRELVSFGRYPYSQTKLNEKDKERVEYAIGCMAMQEYADKFLDQLSGGERQRAFISMVIAQDTDYILLDEPLNNLDMKHSVKIMQLLRNLVDEHGKTVVLVLHDINFASHYSDYIVALKNGQLLRQGPVNEVIDSGVLNQVYDMNIDIQELGGSRVCLYFK